jgi:hypothetical protein
MNVKYKLKEIYPKVFLVTMDNSYDLAMTFCRVQEFYESPYKEIRGKYFTMAEFQRLYTMRRGSDCFTYPSDWAGFNIPSQILWDCYGYFSNFQDLNQYDEVMQEIYETISPCEKFYIIGSQTGNQTTIDHEVAHAFYYLYPVYKKEANKIISQLPKRLEKKITDWLSEIGYNKKVFKDEIQAYLSAESLNSDINISVTENKKIDEIEKKLKILVEEYKKMD